jgi:hypothetical protein
MFLAESVLYRKQEDVLRIWHHVGQTIGQQLLQKKGTRIERVGTFTLDIKGRPVFVFQVKK